MEGYKSACMRLCTVWPLSVKVESSAEAYGKPQPSPRQLTIDAHLQEKPSETYDLIYLSVFFISSTLAFSLNTLLTYHSRSLQDRGACYLNSLLQRCRWMVNFQNSCVVTIQPGSKPVCSAHRGLGLI